MTMLTRGRAVLALCLGLLCSGSARCVDAQAIAELPRDPSEVSSPIGQSSSSRDVAGDSGGTPAAAGAGMMAVATPSKPERGIAWAHLFESSLMFLSVDHVFRYTTEYGTR